MDEKKEKEEKEEEKNKNNNKKKTFPNDSAVLFFLVHSYIISRPVQ